MPEHPKNSNTFEGLRQRAEELLRQQPGSSDHSNVTDIFHQMEVAYTELEIQAEELKRAQEELSALHREYQGLYELAPCGYLTVNPQGIITRANLTAVGLLGADRSLLLRSALSVFIASGWENALLKARHEAERSGEKQSVELPLRPARPGSEGEPWALAEIEAQTDEDGSLLEWRIVLMDISGRKKAEKERESLQRKLTQDQKKEALKRMAGAVAHHFNNQLSVVQGYLELSMAEVVSQSELGVNLKRAMAASKRASEISHLLLTYLGKTEQSKEVFDLSDLCRDNLTLFQAMLPSQVKLKSDLTGSGLSIEASRNNVQLIVSHLITNAWEAMEDSQGTVYLGTRKVAKAKIPTANIFPADWQPTDEAYACLEVSDTGCGMSASDLDKLFDPFFTRKMTGRGLGLAVVQGVISNCKGAIAVQSVPGQGSTFCIFVPLSTAQETSSGKEEQTVLGRHTPHAGQTVLLVEDQDMVRRMGEKMLLRLGYQVLSAADGKTALDLFKKNQLEIICVLTDFSMPMMSGWDLIADLRTIDPNIPVILASGYPESQVLSGKDPQRPQAFLHKPYQMDNLKAVLLDVLGKSHS